MEKLACDKGNETVHSLLAKKDSVAAEKIHPNNLRRVIRALEVCRLTGKTFTQVNEESRREAVYNVLTIGIKTDREKLYNRIDTRVDRMMEDGLLAEIKKLKSMGIGRETTAMQAIGYKELLEYLGGNLSLDEAVEKIKQESRRYAKRQMTWFRRNDKINWVDIENPDEMRKIFEKCREFMEL